MGNITKNSYVSWPVSGGVAVGQVISIVEKDVEFNNEVVKASADDPAAKITLPSDQVVYVATNRLNEITEDEYKKHLSGLAELFTRKSGGNVNASKELEVAQADLAYAKSTIETLTAEKTTLTANINELTNKVTDLTKQLETANAKILKAEKDALAQDRYTKLAAVDGVESVDTDKTKALAKLAEMSVENFDIVLSMATSFYTKLKSANAGSKTEDNTATAEQVIESALDNAQPDKEGGDTIVAGAGSAVTENPLLKAMMNRYGVKSE